MKTRLLALVALGLSVLPTVAQADGALSDVWWLWLVRWLTNWSGGWYGY